jgi:hypothetical protein
MKKLPSEKELLKLEMRARKRLIALFKQEKWFRGLERHLQIGLDRIAEKGAFARMFAKYLNEGGFAGVEEFANKVFLGEDHIEALEWLRFPTVFKFKRGGQRRHDAYLLALSDLQWDYTLKQFRPLDTSRLI